MAEKIRAEEGAIEKGAAAVENARLGIDNRIKDSASITALRISSRRWLNLAHSGAAMPPTPSTR